MAGYLGRRAPVDIPKEEPEPEQPDRIDGWAAKPIKPRPDWTPPLAWRASIEQAAKRGEIAYFPNEIHKTPKITPGYLAAMQRETKPSVFLYKDNFGIGLWSGSFNLNPDITPALREWVAKGAVIVNQGGATEYHYASVVAVAKEVRRVILIETTPYSSAWQSKLDCPRTLILLPPPFAEYRRKRNAEMIALWEKAEAAGQPVTRWKLW